MFIFKWKTNRSPKEQLHSYMDKLHIYCVKTCISYKIDYLVIQVIYYLLSSEIISDTRNTNHGCKVHQKRLSLDRDAVYKMHTNITVIKIYFGRGRRPRRLSCKFALFSLSFAFLLAYHALASFSRLLPDSFINEDMKTWSKCIQIFALLASYRERTVLVSHRESSRRTREGTCRKMYI
jgi:hypothetical protein